MNQVTLITSVSWLKRTLSFLTPIKLQEWRSTNHALLELFLHHNQFQLVYDHAIYSYGLHYKPFLLGFQAIDPQCLASAKRVLVLGSGLGSIPEILQHYYAANRTFTIVDIDTTILNLCSQYLQARNIKDCTYVREDALTFVARSFGTTYQLICMDIFKDISVPSQFLKLNYWKALVNILAENGLIVFNYIPSDEEELETLRETLSKVSSRLAQVNYRKNIIWILYK